MESTILVVDDVQLFLEIQKEFLKDSPVRVITAPNGADALQAVTTWHPDLIFMDHEMPEMTGAVCCRTIKSDPAFANIPVVMVTAKGDPDSETICRLAGCDDYLTKPLNRNLYLETASRFVRNIERREPRQAVELSGVIHSRGTTHPCTLENLSSGGAFMLADFPGEVGRVIQVSFTLPGGSAIECQGKIVWRKDPRGGHRTTGLGVSFILAPVRMKAALGNFLKAASGY